MNTTLDVAAVLSACIWPIVVLSILLAYRKPLGLFLSGLSGRLTKLSAFDISIELAALPSPSMPWTDPSIPESSEMAGGEVYSTTLSILFEHIGAGTPADYLIVDVKDCRFWFVSRVFIFTTFLEEMRGLKCVVFVQTSGEHYRRLLGLASPNALRTSLGQAFPWLEMAVANALKLHGSNFLAPALPSATAGQIIQAFINDKEMRLRCDPAELIKPTNTCQVPTDQLPTTPIKPGEWERLGVMETWEHTNWLDFSIPRVSEAVTKSFFERDSAIYVEIPGVSIEERIRALLLRKSPYIALINSHGEFKALLDRQKLVALVGESFIKQ